MSFNTLLSSVKHNPHEDPWESESPHQHGRNFASPCLLQRHTSNGLGAPAFDSCNIEPRAVYGPRNAYGPRVKSSWAKQGHSVGSKHGAEAKASAKEGSHATHVPSLSDLPPAIIEEILCHLNARSLGRFSCCSRLFASLSAESAAWKRCYYERWRSPPKAVLVQTAPIRSFVDASNEANKSSVSLSKGPGRWWHDVFRHKEERARAMLGRYKTDAGIGHTAGVRCVSILPQSPIAVSAGYDSTVRIWDLDTMLPLATSAPLGDTIRAAVADSAFLAVGGTDCLVRVWAGYPSCPHLFDVDGLWSLYHDVRGHEVDSPESSVLGSGLPFPQQDAPAVREGECVRGYPVGDPLSPAMPALLSGHAGPVSCLALNPSDSTRLFSGSWDHSVICWDVGARLAHRGRTPKGSHLRREASKGQLQEYLHKDWVWAAEARRGLLFSTAGSSQYTWHVESGELLRRRAMADAGKVYAVQVDMRGQLVFTAGQNGMVRVYDERVRGKVRKVESVVGGVGGVSLVEEPVGAWITHSAPVNALAFEDPWLVSASADHCCAMMDMRKMVSEKDVRLPSGGNKGGKGTLFRRLGGSYSALLCADFGHERIVCGTTDSTLHVYDFRKAQVYQGRAQDAKTGSHAKFP